MPRCALNNADLKEAHIALQKLYSVFLDIGAQRLGVHVIIPKWGTGNAGEEQRQCR